MFQRLDFSGFNPIYLKWIKPKKNETIANYATRLKEQITEEKPIIFGLSLGGMMAVEIAKQIPTGKIILLSSIINMKELPLLYRLSAFLSWHKLIPKQLYKQTNPFIHWLFGAKTLQDKKLLKEVLRDTDLDFVVWAIDEIINWKNQFVPKNLHRIHGTKDFLLPIKVSPPDFRIENGSHLMVLNRAEEVSLALKSILN